MDWDLYEKRINVVGQLGRDRAIAREQDAIRRRAECSPALKTVKINETAMQLFIHATEVQSEKTFNTLPGEVVNIGDIILWNEMHWMVTNIDFDDEVTRSGRIVQCNRQIRWQNRETGAIIARWCLTTKPYTSNIDLGSTLATSNREYKVQLPYDEESRLVDLDRRFLLEEIGGAPKAYVVTSVDTLTNRYEDIDGGFLIWNMKQGEYNPATDNAELMIADYVAPEEGPVAPPTTSLLTCTIKGRNKIPAGIGGRLYQADFQNPGHVAPIWNVTVPAGFEDHIFWSVDDAGLTLAADAGAIGEAAVLTLRDNKGLYEPAILRVEVVSLL